MELWAFWARAPSRGSIVDALKRLEYRGYDSAGVATLENGRLERRRAEGKLRNLEAKLAAEPLPGAIGIGHTRWATHGKPTEANAHPHAARGLAVVHNGIIENFKALREELAAKGYGFVTETDSEIAALVVEDEIATGKSPADAVFAALKRMRGAFALVYLFEGHDDLLIGARQGAPLAIGYGDGEMYLGSDALALAPFTDRVAYLEEGDWVVVTRAGAEVRDASGSDRRAAHPAQPGRQPAGREGQLPALHGQGDPRAAGSRRAHARPLHRHGGDAAQALRTGRPTRRRSPGSRSSAAAPPTWPGSSASTGSSASPGFRSRSTSPRNTATARRRSTGTGSRIVISQSGETADTLASLRYVKERGSKTIGVVNVPDSSIARLTDAAAPTLAGPEIGVASTKAFTCQLAALAALAIGLGARARRRSTRRRRPTLLAELVAAPGLLAEALKLEPAVEKLARAIAHARDVLYLGRGTGYPVALEGALKLKELSYIHAEGYAAGELKHGPIALIDPDMPVVVIAPRDAVFEKTVSNMQEVAARGGRIILIGERHAAEEAAVEIEHFLAMPDVGANFAPIVYAVPVQMLAYHTAVIMGKDADQPRNLAKSVTVE